MNVRISLALEARETFLSLHKGFSLERVDVIWAIMESIPGLDPAIEITDPRLNQFTSSRLWPFSLTSL